MANDCVRHRLVFVAQDILISHLKLMVFQLVPYFPDILCVFGGIVFRCVHSKIDIWIRLSNGFPFRPVHTTSTMWRVMVAISEQFSVRFPSLTQKISQIKLQIELVLWIGRSFVFVAKHRNEYQKWEKRREREKRRYYGRPLVDWCYHRNKYIHHCDSQENGFCWRNNGNHNQNHSQIRIQFDENSLWFDRIRIYHNRQQQQQHQRTEMLIEYRVRLHPHHQ